MLGKNSKSLVERRQKELELYLQTLLQQFPRATPTPLAYFLHFHLYVSSAATLCLLPKHVPGLQPQSQHVTVEATPTGQWISRSVLPSLVNHTIYSGQQLTPYIEQMMSYTRKV